MALILNTVLDDLLTGAGQAWEPGRTAPSAWSAIPRHRRLRQQQRRHRQPRRGRWRQRHQWHRGCEQPRRHRRGRPDQRPGRQRHAGSDFLHGGRESTGPGGEGDIFVFDTARSTSNVDTIAGFEQGLDKIGLMTAIFPAVGASLEPDKFIVRAGGNALDANDFIVYRTGTVHYDGDGDGSGGASAMVAFAVLAAVSDTLESSDFVVDPVPPGP